MVNNLAIGQDFEAVNDVQKDWIKWTSPHCSVVVPHTLIVVFKGLSILFRISSRHRSKGGDYLNEP